jgi:hypothetical protein
MDQEQENKAQLTLVSSQVQEILERLDGFALSDVNIQESEEGWRLTAQVDDRRVVSLSEWLRQAKTDGIIESYSLVKREIIARLWLKVRPSDRPVD